MNARPSSLRRQALALEPRFLLDAAAVTTVADVAKNVAPTDTAPGVDAQPNKGTVTIKDSTDSFPAVDLFDNVTVSRDTGGEALENLVITVDRTGANHALIIDGTEISLQATTLTGSTAGNNYAYDVRISGGTTTITIAIRSSLADQPADVARLIDGMAYRPMDKSVESGTVHVKLASLSDTGSQTATLDIGAEIQIINEVNVAPVLSDSSLPDLAQTLSVADLGSSRELAYSRDGKFLYAADATGSIAVFAVGSHDELTFKALHARIDGLGNLADLAVSADGKSLYAISGSQIITLDIGADGTLSNGRAISAGGEVRNLAVSDDGQQVYVSTQYGGLSVYNRDATTGDLTFVHSLDEGAVGGGRTRTVISTGDYVFVASGTSLVTLQRNENGRLDKLDFGSLVTGISTGVTPALAATPGGDLIFISDGVSIRIYALRDGNLEARGTVSLTGVNALAVTADGGSLYATAGNGTLVVYTITANDTLVQRGTITGMTGAASLALSPDGDNVVVGGGGLVRLSTIQAYTVGGDPVPFAGNVTLSDVNADPRANGAGDYNGTTITVSADAAHAAGSSFGFAEANGLTRVGNEIHFNGQAIASFDANGGTLTVSFTAATSTATANLVLRQLTYANASAAANAEITLTLRGNDGALDSNAVVIVLPVNAPPQLDTGYAGSYTPDRATSETPYSLVLPEALFTDASGDTLSWAVTGLPAGLSFDPNTRTLSGTTTAVGSFDIKIIVTDAYGAKAEHTLAIEIDQIGNRPPVVSDSAAGALPHAPQGQAGYSVALDAGMFADPDSIYSGSTLTWSTSPLPAGLSFDPATRTISGTPSATGDYTVTITVTDEHGQTAEHTMTLRVISAAEAGNSAPVLTPDSDTLNYSNDGTLAGFNSYVSDTMLSADGKTLLIAASANQLGGGATTLYVYSRDPVTGDLTQRQAITTLAGLTSMSYSKDGSLLYVATGTGTAYTLTVLRAEGDGTFSEVGAGASIAEKVLQVEVNGSGDTVYAISATKVYAYTVGADGALTKIADYTPTAGLGTAVSMQLGADGTVFVQSAGRITVYAAAADGSLTYAGQLTRTGTALNWTDAANVATQVGTLPNGNAFTGINAFVVTEAGNLHLTTDNFYLTTLHYDSAAKSMSLVDAKGISVGGQTAHGLASSADGKLLYLGSAGGAGLTLYRVGDDGVPVSYGTVATAGGMTRFAISADGKSIYGGKHRFFGTVALGIVSAGDESRGAHTEGATSTAASGVTLSDADYDARNGGAGDYQGATITVAREGGENAEDSFGFSDGAGLTLVGNEIRLNDVKIASFESVDGKLILTFTAATTTATANEVLHRITFSQDNPDPAANIRLTLVVQDEFASGKASLTLDLVVTPVNDAPVVSVTPANPGYEPGKAPVNVFKDAEVSAVEAGQAITGMTFVVTGVTNGANETLTVDGTAIALVAGSGTTAGGLAYTVTVDNGTVTLVFSSSAGIGGDAAATLIDGVAYANDAATPTTGERTITLAAIRDNGGTANNGADTAEPALTARVQVQYEAPVITTPADSIGSPDLYAPDGESFDKLMKDATGAVSIGNHIYVIQPTTEWNSNTFEDDPVYRLYVLERAADGTLSLLHTYSHTDISGLTGGSLVRASADGTSVYVVGNAGVTLFSRDAATGALSVLDTFAADATAMGITDVLAQGDTVYVTTGDSLRVYTRQGDTLTLAHTYTDAGDTGLQLDGANTLALTPDGRFLVVGTSGGHTLASVFRVEATGELSFVAAAQGTAPAASDQFYYTSSLTLSPDGKTLYATDFSGTTTTLHTLTLGADGSLTAMAQTALGEPVRQLIVSPDGSALFVIGEGSIGIYRRGADGTPALVNNVTGWGEDAGGINLNEIRGATLSADGTQLLLVGSFSFDDGLLTLDLRAAPAAYTEGAAPTPLLPAAEVSDPQLDALNGGQGDYQGASYTVVREGGANADDQFSFIDGGTLTLDAANGVILRNGVPIATFSQAGGALTITFTAATTRAEAQQVLRGIAYSNTSSDPTRDGSRIALTVTVNDGDGHSDTLSAEVDLTGVNDPPVLETTPLDPTFQAEGEAKKLFDGTVVDTVESGQNIARIVLTVSPATADDYISVDGAKIPLRSVSGAFTLPTGQQYGVNVANGVATVTLYLNTSGARAAEVIDSLAYGHSGDTATGTREIRLSVSEWANENTSTTLADPVIVTLAGPATPNTAPTLGGGATVPYTERAEPVLIAPGATLSDAQMDLFNGGAGNYDGAVLTITLGDGHSASDVLGLRSANGLTLEGNVLRKDGVEIARFSQSDGVLTITFSDSQGTVPTTTDVQNTLRQLTYANNSSVPADSVAVGVVLTDQRGLASQSLDFVIDITAVNDTPVVEPDPVTSLGELKDVQTLADIAGIGTPRTSLISEDGSRVYLADSQGAIALFERDAASGALTYVRTFSPVAGLGGVSQMLISADGKNLYAMRSDSNAIGIFNVAADGSLSHVSTMESDYAVDENALMGMQGMTLSEDGKHVYLINSTNLVTLSRDAATGALTYESAIGGDMWSPPYLWSPTDITSRGDLVFVVTHPANGSTLIVYQRDAAGALTPLTSLHSGDTDANGNVITIDNIQHVAVSEDGRTIFISNSRTSDWNGTVDHPQEIHAFTLDPAAGTLTHRGTLTGTATVEGIALSADGKALYVTLSDGTLRFYATSTLSLLETKTDLTGAGQVAVSADGGVLVVGDALTVLHAPGTPAPVAIIGGDPVLIAPTLQIHDAELDAAANGAGDYSGASLLLAGPANGSFGVLVSDGYTMDGNTVLFNGQPIATLTQSGGTATLSITAALTREQANALLHRITYASGANDTAGPRAITIRLNDGDVDSAAHSIDITVREPNRAPVEGADPYAPGEALRGRDFTLVLPDTLFSDPDGDTLAWSVSGLPQGLSFDPDTRTISGRAALTGSFTLTITVTDPEGATATRTITLEVAEPPNTAPADSGMPATPDAAQAGLSYSYTLPAGLFTDADGDALTWEVDGLPDGLVFDAGTRTIQGRAPVAGSYTLTLRATDPSGASVSREVTLTVVQPDVAPTPAPGPDAPDTDFGPVTPDLSTLQRPFDFADRVVVDAEEATTWFASGSITPSPASAAGSLGIVARDGMQPAQPRSASQVFDQLLADSLARQDAQDRAPWRMDTPQGETSRLVVLAGPEARGISASTASLSGDWHYDVNTNRQVYALPAGLIRSTDAIAAIGLRMADGSALPPGLRLDAARGLIVAPGQTAPERLALVLVVRNANGDTLSVPVTITAERQALWLPQDALPLAADAGDSAHKPALSQQLRDTAAHDLLGQARQFLASLGEDVAQAVPGGAQPAAPLTVAS